MLQVAGCTVEIMLAALLAVIGVLGLGAGVWTVVAAVSTPHRDAFGVAAAMVYGSIPFAIGVIALGAVAVVLAVDKASRNQGAVIKRLAEITINEAKHAAYHRAATPPPLPPAQPTLQRY